MRTVEHGEVPRVWRRDRSAVGRSRSARRRRSSACGTTPCRRGRPPRSLRAPSRLYGVKEYEEALRLGRGPATRRSPRSTTGGARSPLSAGIGFAELALGDVGEAKRMFRAALEQAHVAAAISLEAARRSSASARCSAPAGEPEQAATGAHLRARSRAAAALKRHRGATGARSARGRATSRAARRRTARGGRHEP